MTANNKTRLESTGLGPSIVGRGFSHDKKVGAQRLPFAEPFPRACQAGRFATIRPDRAPARHVSIFAFLSQKQRKTHAGHSTQQDERNRAQVIENTQSRYTPLDTIRNTRSYRFAAPKRPRPRRGEIRLAEESSLGLKHVACWRVRNAAIYRWSTQARDGVGRRSWETGLRDGVEKRSSETQLDTEGNSAIKQSAMASIVCVLEYPPQSHWRCQRSL